MSTSPEPSALSGQIIDPDLDLHDPAQRTERPRVDTLTAIAVGGAAGALARYAAGVVWPAGPGAFPWATFAVNVVGCALIGVLTVVITDMVTPHRLVRPLLGVGVLGGFTTFSTYSVDALNLSVAGRPGTALAHLLLTVFAALAAVTAGVATTRATLRLAVRLRERRETPGDTPEDTTESS